ncbi:16844_t:CDS:2 [Acaulospora morrowiae]|uniref:16844_t:CDS:1 n=1 Tax=Acaulospora morrowiae TaxID=94023 RepID=A0A9N9FBA0_9GLOM|nr:16844_t:CDS:2 [Acaulospora morrowiae]
MEIIRDRLYATNTGSPCLPIVIEWIEFLGRNIEMKKRGRAPWNTFMADVYGRSRIIPYSSEMPSSCTPAQGQISLLVHGDEVTWVGLPDPANFV